MPLPPPYLGNLRTAHLHAAAWGREPLLPLLQVRQRQQQTPRAAPAAAEFAGLSHVSVSDCIAAAAACGRGLSRPHSSPSPLSSLLPLLAAGLLFLLLRRRQPIDAGAAERPGQSFPARVGHEGSNLCLFAFGFGVSRTTAARRCTESCGRAVRYIDSVLVSRTTARRCIESCGRAVRHDCRFSVWAVIRFGKGGAGLVEASGGVRVRGETDDWRPSTSKRGRFSPVAHLLKGWSRDTKRRG